MLTLNKFKWMRFFIIATFYMVPLKGYTSLVIGDLMYRYVDLRQVKIENGQTIGYIAPSIIKQKYSGSLGSTASAYIIPNGERVKLSSNLVLCKTNIDGLAIQSLTFTDCYNRAFVGSFTIKTPQSTLNVFDVPRINVVVYDKTKLIPGATYKLTSFDQKWYDFVGNIAGDIAPIFLYYITIPIAPSKAPVIYFPDSPYPGGSPLIQLPFTYSGTGTNSVQAHANKVIKMCLNDGNDINSSSFELSFDHSSTHVHDNASYFYLEHFPGVSNWGAETKNSIPYQIYITDPLTHVEKQISRRSKFTWSNITLSKVNTINVMIDGKPTPCVLTPLRINVPSFNATAKVAGSYISTITMEFTPSLNN